MASRNSVSVSKVVSGTAVVLLLSTAAFIAPKFFDGIGAAWAEGEGSGQGGQGEGGNQGGAEGGQGAGQGGPSEDSEGKGPKAGSSADNGGKPVWAQEGIPEVELGRLNVARSPEKVLNQAFEEAMSSVSAEIAAFYNLSIEDMVQQLTFNFDNVTYIDSPLQNLALLKDALLDGTSALSTKGVTTDADTLIAVFLATASDKAGDGPTPLVVEAVTTILGNEIAADTARAEAIAAEAYTVWVAIVAGHG